MTFTYSLATDIGLVRLELGDYTSGSAVGVRPNGDNLSDEEIQVLLTREGSVMCATAAACELRARQWSTTANIAVGPRSEQLGKVADNWAARANELRAQYGGAAGYAFSASFARDDGYADAASEYTS